MLPIDMTRLLGPGVYILTLRDEVVYIGQSTILVSRLGDHAMKRTNIPFDRIFVILCKSYEREWIEGKLIAAFWPRYNRRSPITGRDIIEPKGPGALYRKGSRNRYNQTLVALVRRPNVGIDAEFDE